MPDRSLRPARIASTVLFALACPLLAHAEALPPLPLGPPPVDEVLRSGREVAPLAQRPDLKQMPQVACSFRAPVCVHAPAAAPPAALLWTLRHAESAFRTFDALGLPAPLPDDGLGGSAAFDLYLSTAPDARPLTTIDLLARGRGLDTQSAFTILPVPALPTSCQTRDEVARAVAQAIVLRLDPGVEDGALSMTASYLASLSTDCELAELAAVDDFQEHPERALSAGSPLAPDGALLFPWYLDATFGQGNPGALITALLFVAGQRTPPGAWAWNNEPDLFDALRVNARTRDATLDQLLLDFAVARAFVGSRSDDTHLPDVRRFGDMGRVRFEWSVAYDSLPRRLAPSRPLDPTGMTYLWVDLAGAPPQSSLTMAADWELPSIFRWTLIKVDKNGAEAGRIDIAGVYGDSHVERTVSSLDGLAGIIVVGVNAGSIDRGHPFDPDETPFMPHSYTVTLAK
jgi:hypothetical protein